MPTPISITAEKLESGCALPRSPSDTPCACGSGQMYNTCCQPIHEGKQNGVKPSSVVRARFSAFVYGLTPFLISSTHPNMKDYAAEDDQNDKPSVRRTKRQIWEKGLKNFAEEFEFANLTFDNEEEENNNSLQSDIAIVNIKLERKLRGSQAYDKIDELTRLKRSTESGEWLYLGSEMVNKGSSNVIPPKRMVVGTNKRGVPKGN